MVHSHHISSHTFFHDFDMRQFFAQVHLVDEGDHSYRNYSIHTIATLLDVFCCFHLSSAHLFTWRLSTGSYCKLTQKCNAFICFIFVNKILSNILHVYNNQPFLNWEHLTLVGFDVLAMLYMFSVVSAYTGWKLW